MVRPERHLDWSSERVEAVGIKVTTLFELLSSTHQTPTRYLSPVIVIQIMEAHTIRDDALAGQDGFE